MKKLIILLLTLSLWMPVQAQQAVDMQEIPQGAVVYSLPRTCVRIVAQAQYTQFTAGPYARYARKFLGIDVPQENTTSYRLTHIEMTPMLEADPHQMYVADVSSKNVSPWFLQLTSQGLVMLADSRSGTETKWRFPSMSGEPEVTDAGLIANIKQEQTTLYRSEVQGTTITPVPVQQSQLVEKTLEERADEAARKIFQLRNKRMAIITGDTDAIFSGEAMGSALEEMRRMEEEYMKLFMGVTVTGKSHLAADVVPDAEKTKYIVFRISEKDGLLPAENVSGRPIVLDMSLIEGNIPVQVRANEQAARSGTRVFYRQPVIMLLRLLDGQQELLQARTPIYQRGQVLNFIIN